MPDEAEHTAKAEHNEGLYRAISSSGVYVDWEIIALFYAALHLVDAWLSRSGVHPQNHMQRRLMVRQDPRLHRLYGHYSRLDDRSRDARYTAMSFPGDYGERLYTNEYEPVRDVVRRLLGIN